MALCTVYHMKDTVLDKVDKVKDLAVLFINFSGATEHCLLNLYKTMVRPHIEYTLCLKKSM